MDKTFEVVVGRPPHEVFAWLFDADKVPQWTSGLEDYEVLGGSIAAGTRIRQTLEVSGTRRTFEEEVLEWRPPTAAASRFTLEGIGVQSSFGVAADGDGGARVTRTVKAKAESFGARFLLPIVQPHLERKLAADLERLRELLS
jgi:uncharacterized protein YndB with AHSA1/START domain